MNDKRIVIIGPVYPYKGGIAHYTSLLAKELNKSNDVTLVSFKLQYPRLLYPGKQQKDHSNDQFKFDQTRYMINTINPFNWFNVARTIKQMKPDLVIFQWWHPFFAFCFMTIARLVSKKTKVLFTCHNVLPHDRFPLAKFLTKRTLKQSHYYIVHSKEDEQNLKKLILNVSYERTFHPTYDIFNQQTDNKLMSREALQIKDQEKVLLFFGFIREYKGLKFLLKAMPRVIETLDDVKLLIVGDFYDHKEDYVTLIKTLNIESSVRIVDGYIPDQEVGKYFLSSNLVVLPYTSATQSGIIQIAYGFNKPVIATDVGGLPEVVLDGQTGYIVPPNDSETLANKIIEYFQDNKELEFERAIEQEQDKYSWHHMHDVISRLTKL